MKLSLSASLLLHSFIVAILLWNWSFLPPVEKKTEAIQVTMVEPHVSKKPPNIDMCIDPTLNPAQPLHQQLAPAFSSDGPDPAILPLDKLLTANDYISRVKSRLDPYWQMIVSEHIKYRKRAKLGKVSCKTSMIIEILSDGTIATSQVISSCTPDQKFDNMAVEAIRGQGMLPPPPSNLLTDGSLVIEWNFYIR